MKTGWQATMDTDPSNPTLHPQKNGEVVVRLSRYGWPIFLHDDHPVPHHFFTIFLDEISICGKIESPDLAILNQTLLPTLPFRTSCLWACLSPSNMVISLGVQKSRAPESRFPSVSPLQRAMNLGYSTGIIIQWKSTQNFRPSLRALGQAWGCPQRIKPGMFNLKPKTSKISELN